MADNEIRNPAKAYFKWKMPVITKSEDDWNLWNTEDRYNRTMFIGYNDTTTPHVASLFIIVDGKAMQAVGDDVIARIAGLETNTAQALADIQELIDRVNAQQLEISNLQQECQRILAQAADTVLDARTWAEGTDEEVADLGGEHSAKGWAQKANDIVAAGLPSDATFDHITVTGSSKFGQDPDRANQPGLEIESTGEIQAYRTINMMNGATVSYDETVEMPWSDSSTKVPNTAWVQQAVQHGSIDPNSELTVKKLSTTTGGGSLNYVKDLQTNTIDVAQADYHRMELSSTKYRVTTSGKTVDTQSKIQLDSSKITASATAGMAFTASVRGLGNDSAYSFKVGDGADADRLYFTVYPRAVLGHGLLVGGYNITPVALSILRDAEDSNNWKAKFYVTPTVPDIANAADSSDKVPNTKWVHAAIAAGGGGGGSGAVTSVNGKTGEVVLAAADVGAATTADITTALEPYAKTADVTTTLADYAKSADVTTEITTATAGLQPKLTAGANITISEDNVISAAGSAGGAVTSVNGKTGEVVLSASDVGAASSSDLANYVTTDAMNTELTHYSTTAAIDAKLADYQRKLIAGDGIAISESNVISVTGGTGGGAVSSVNGKTGEVVLNATDVGAITGAEADTKITTALEPYAKTADVTTTLEPYAKSADVTAEITAAVSPLATTEALTTGLAGKQDKLTAGSGIAISDTNVISATVSSPVDSVNGKTGAVVLSGEDIRLHPNVGEEYIYPAVSDVIDTISNYMPDGVSGDNKLVDNSSLWTYLALYQPKLTAGEGITISAENVISATGGGAVTSVNGNTGAVVLTGDNVMTASDSTTSINSALAGKQANITADTELTCKSITTSYDSALKSLNYAGNISFTGDSGNGSLGKITANELFTNASGYYGTRIQASGITCTSGAGATTWFNLNSSDKTISVDGTITATSPAVDANNNQVATTSWVKTALAGKQDSLTASSDLTVGSLTAGSADSGLYAGTYSIRYTYNGNDKLFVDATGPYVSNLTGGDLGTATGAFNWYINTTTDYNKFNVFNRYYVTDEATHEVTTNDALVFSIGGSPDNHSTWIDFTANYLSFKGDTNFGETGMNHNMNFNGTSRFNGGAGFYNTVVLGHGETTEEGGGGTPTTTPASIVYVDGNLEAYGSVLFSKGFTANDSVSIMGNTTFWKTDTEGGITPWASYDKSTGVFNIDYLTSTDGGTSANRVTIMADSREANYGATFNLPVTVSDASFKRTSTLAADDNSTEVPTTAWVKSAIAAGGGGSVPDDITCKTLGVTDTSTVHILNVGDGKEGQKFNCDADASFGYNVNIGWTSGRLKCMRDEYNWLFDFNRNANAEYRLRFNEPVTILYPMPAATDSSNKVPTTAWVQGAITAKAATKPTLTHVTKSGNKIITTTKVEQCDGGKLCTIYWRNSSVTSGSHYFIDVPADFTDATITSTIFTSNDNITPAVWVATAKIASSGQIQLDVASTNTTSSPSASAIIVLYKA